MPSEDQKGVELMVHPLGFLVAPLDLSLNAATLCRSISQSGFYREFTGRSFVTFVFGLFNRWFASQEMSSVVPLRGQSTFFSFQCLRQRPLRGLGGIRKEEREGY